MLTREQALTTLTTYQDRLEEACGQGPEAYREAFSQPPGGVAAHEIDREMKITRVNPAELGRLGYREDEMLGQPAWQFIVMEGVSQRAIDKKLSGAVELKPFVRAFKRADGSAVTMLVLDRLIRDALGQVVGIRTVLTEIDSSAEAQS